MSLTCGRDGCSEAATHYIQFHQCFEESALPPHLVCAPCLRDLRRTFEHGRAVRCPKCAATHTKFSDFVPMVEEVRS